MVESRNGLAGQTFSPTATNTSGTKQAGRLWVTTGELSHHCAPSLSLLSSPSSSSSSPPPFFFFLVLQLTALLLLYFLICTLLNAQYVPFSRYWDVDNVYAKQNGGDYDFVVEKTEVNPEFQNYAWPSEQRFWNDLLYNSSKWGTCELVLVEGMLVPRVRACVCLVCVCVCVCVCARA